MGEPVRNMPMQHLIHIMRMKRQRISNVDRLEFTHHAHTPHAGLARDLRANLGTLAMPLISKICVAHLSSPDIKKLKLMTIGKRAVV